MSVVYRRNAENEPVSRIKMADYRVLVSMGRYSYLRNEAIIRKTPLTNTILRLPVCLVCRLVASVADESLGNTHTHTHRATTVTLAAHACRGLIIGEQERANLVVQLARFFYIYMYISSVDVCRNVLRNSK